MKKLISIVLMLVLIFSIAVPSFASEIPDEVQDETVEPSASTEFEQMVLMYLEDFDGFFFTSVASFFSEMLNRVYYNSLIPNTSNMLSQLLEINSSNRDIFSEILLFRKGFFGDTVIQHVPPLSEVIYNGFRDLTVDVQTIVDVLADPLDLKLKENQRDNFSFAIDEFFTPEQANGLDTGDFLQLGEIVSDFKDAFDMGELMALKPLQTLEDSEALSKWFTIETGKMMDPYYGSGLGGGGVSGPPPESESPFQGTNVLRYAVSNLVTDTIYNGKGWKSFSQFNDEDNLFNTPETDVYSDIFSTTGFIKCTSEDVLYLYNFDFVDGRILLFFGNGISIRNQHGYKFTLNEGPNGSYIFPYGVDENGVMKIDLSSQGLSLFAVRFEFPLISDASIITINEYPLKGLEPDPDPDPEPEPEPEPIINYLPTATSTFEGSEIYNGKGWKENTRISSSGAYSPMTGYYSTGFMSVSDPTLSNVVYLYNVSFDTSSYSRFFYYVTSSGNQYIDGGLVPSPDSNGVIAIPLDMADGIKAFRFVASYLGDDSIVSINQYPIQTTSVASYSLRAQAPTVEFSDEVVTSYYQDRMNELYSMLGGLNNG